MREEQADVKLLLTFLLRGLLVALPLGVLAALAAFYLSGRLPPTFEATATILATRAANTASTTATSLSAPPIEASAYSEIALTRPVLEDALARLGLRGLDAEAFEGFRDAVTVSVGGERDALSNLITVSVQAGAAPASARRANAVAEALVAGQVALAPDPEHDLQVGPALQLRRCRVGQEAEELVCFVGARRHPQRLHEGWRRGPRCSGSPSSARRRSSRAATWWAWPR